MDKYIIVNLNMFTFGHQVFIMSSNAMNHYGSYETEDLPSALIAAAYENGIETIKVSGNKQYAEMIVNEIEVLEKMNYNQRKIKVEVI